MAEKYDFSGYATKNDLLCADGRTIRRNAFKDCDGKIVPLVWQHSHGKPGDVLGHALLENRDDGVYTYGSFNNTQSGQNAKELVNHGDVRALSIYANQLIQKGSDVLHGMIREVSLCLAGANPGAEIEDLAVIHFDDEGAEFEAQIYNGENIELYHSEEAEVVQEEVKEEMADATNNQTDIQSIVDSLSEDQCKALMHALTIQQNEDENVIKHEDKSADDETVQDVINTMSDKQKNAMYYVISELMNGNGGKEENDDEEDDEMMQHAYENNSVSNDVIMHDALMKLSRMASALVVLRNLINSIWKKAQLLMLLTPLAWSFPPLLILNTVLRLAMVLIVLRCCFLRLRVLITLLSLFSVIRNGLMLFGMVSIVLRSVALSLSLLTLPRTRLVRRVI